MSQNVRQIWRLFFWCALLLGVVIAGALAQPPDNTLLWKAFFDASHSLFCGILALLCLHLVLAWRGSQNPTLGDQLLAFAGAVSIGATFEIVQFFLPRDADPTDLLRDALGAAAFLLMAWGLKRTTASSQAPRAGQRLLALGSALVLLGAAFLPVAALTRDVLRRDAALPVLCDPRAPWLQRFLALHNAGWDVVELPSAKSVARVTFRSEPHPGFALRETAPDWRDYETLVLEVSSDLPAPVDIVLRIDDAEHDQSFHDRFNRILSVVPGTQVLRIPLDEIRSAPKTRDMDMGRIRKLIVFANAVEGPFALSFGRIWLE